MKTIEQIINTYNSQTLDGRDIVRLITFLTEEQCKKLGIELKAEFKEKHQPIPFTKENVLKQLQADVAFGFKKALNQRGISASLMFECVSMWNWVLEEGLENFDSYTQYGLPLFKATAVKYGFKNEIGNDFGNEDKYAAI